MRDTSINQGNYNEYVKGNYIQGNYINVNSIPKPIGFPQNIPRSSTNQFIGRQKELAALQEQLQKSNEITIAHLEGMGGIGKTELAIDNWYPLKIWGIDSYYGNQEPSKE